MSGSAWPEGMSSVGGTSPGTFLVLAVTVHMLHDVMGLLKNSLTL